MKGLELIDRLKERGIDPLMNLADIAIEVRKEADVAPEGSRDRREWLKLASDVNAELSSYIAPKLKAIEHSGSIGTHEETLEDLDNVD